MITLNQILERANEWLREKGVGPLNSSEIVYVVTKAVATMEGSNSIEDLEKNLVIQARIAICKIRGYEIPNPIEWRGKVIVPQFKYT